MSRSTKNDWLEGPTDLEERDVEDVPVKGKSVRVRALPAKAANEAQTKATEVKATPDGGAMVTVNKARMEVIQLAAGAVDPQFTEEEAEQISGRFGPAFRKLIDTIDELSAIDKDSIEKAEARFQGVDEQKAPEARPNGGDPADASGDRGSDVRLRTGAGAGEDD